MNISQFTDSLLCRFNEKISVKYSTLSKMKSKATFFCKDHGEFISTPSQVIRSAYGCRRCALEGSSKKKAKGIAEFLSQEIEVHGDAYDYTKTDYSSANKSVIITCKIHGDFLQTPNNHLRGRGCKLCGNLKISFHRSDTTEDFIQKAINVHGRSYDYSSAKFENSRTPVRIGCRTHGDFWQLSTSHLSGSGCPKCSRYLTNSNRSITTKEFIALAMNVHGNTYDYSLVNYQGYRNKVSIICPDHGHFSQAPHNHLNGSNCPECSKQLLGESCRLTQEQAITKMKEVHGELYDYSKVQYERSDKKIAVVCKIHGDFEQLPNNHVRGGGCPKCSVSGYNPNKPGTLYYLRVLSSGETRYKIGITNRTVHERFSNSDLSYITIISFWTYEDGQIPRDVEKEILSTFKEYRYEGPPILSSGNTELFTHDILNLDYQPHLLP